MKQTEFEINFNTKKCTDGWKVRCPHANNYDFVSADNCHTCFLDAMALNNKKHQGHNCKEGLFYRNARSEGYLL